MNDHKILLAVSTEDAYIYRTSFSGLDNATFVNVTAHWLMEDEPITELHATALAIAHPAYEAALDLCMRSIALTHDLRTPSEPVASWPLIVSRAGN